MGSPVFPSGEGGGFVPELPEVGDFLLSFNGVVATSGLTVTINTLYAVPIASSGRITVDVISTRVNTSEAGKEATFGIYSDVNGYPGVLISDDVVGSLESQTTLTLSITEIALPKRCWAVLNSNATGTAEIRKLGKGNGFMGANSATSNAFIGLSLTSQTYVSGTLPATFPSGASGELNSPNILLRRS